jgi:hypothetical protein
MSYLFDNDDEIDGKAHDAEKTEDYKQAASLEPVEFELLCVLILEPLGLLEPYHHGYIQPDLVSC